MLRPTRRGHSCHVLPALCVIAALLYFASYNFTSISGFTSHHAAAANATLGFGAVIAISKSGSERIDNLIQAANVSEIELTIPSQPEWTEQDLDNFRSSNDWNTITTGSAMAWLGHHNALKWFLDSGLETALLIEDDVDWDIHLRTEQIPRAATAIRQLVQNSTTGRKPTKDYPYGNPADWDLLYIGHCGDYFNALDEGIGVGYHQPGNLTHIPHVIYPDSTMLPRYELHPFTATHFTALDLPERHRIAHVSAWPLCTFGYAVTRSAALKLITTVAPAREPLDLSGARAYDVAILNACRRNLGISLPPGDWSTVPANPDLTPPDAATVRQQNMARALRCYTVSPELFHHVPGLSTIAIETQNAGEDPHGVPPVDAAGANQIAMRGETSNIGCGFWGSGFDFRSKMQGLSVQQTWQPPIVRPDWSPDTPGHGFAGTQPGHMVSETIVPSTEAERERLKQEGAQRLEWLRREVGRKGRCAKPGRE